MSFNYGSGEEPEEHVGVGGFLDGDKSRVALGLLPRLKAVQGLCNTGQLPSSLHIATLNVGGQVETLADIPLFKRKGL